MNETVKRRRRWPWGLAAVVLIVVGGPLAWRFRPLNQTERSIIGTWRCDNVHEVIYQTYTTDRRLTIRTESLSTSDTETATGRWYAADGVLYTSIDPLGPWTPSHLLSRITTLLQRESRSRGWTVLRDGDTLRFNPPHGLIGRRVP